MVVFVSKAIVRVVGVADVYVGVWYETMRAVKWMLQDDEGIDWDMCVLEF